MTSFYIENVLSLQLVYVTTDEILKYDLSRLREFTCFDNC